MNLMVGQPVGEFEDFVGASVGADFFGRLPWIPGVSSASGPTWDS